MSNTNETPKNKMITFLDNVQREILAEEVPSDNPNILSVKNPVVLHIIPQDNQGKMSVQLLPIFFREFLADKTGDVIFNYKKDQITEISIDAFDFRLEAQYAQMFNKNNSFGVPSQPEAQPQQNENPSVINLFDEK